MRRVFDPIIEAVNETLAERPGVLADDPDGAGWVLTARPAGEGPLASPVPGTGVAQAHGAWMDTNDFPGCQ